ncbi:energy transducer TonB [Sphingobium sp. SCG-1]|nr:energy transducer TonB [Sphingobium sp. SCG-1]
MSGDAASGIMSPLHSTLSNNLPTSSTTRWTTSRYGARRSSRLPVITSVVLIHAFLIGALMQMRHNYIRHQEARMEVVNLMPPAAPPPAEKIPPPPSPPQVVAPPPVVQTPAPLVQVMTTPDAVPVPSVIAAAPTPAFSSSPPVVSPGPSAVQLGDLATRMLSGKPPRYPVESRKLREQGTVVLALTLDVDGCVAKVAIAQSSGFSRLDNAARDAVKRWRWEPTIRGGQPVSVKGIVEIPFVLKA